MWSTIILAKLELLAKSDYLGRMIVLAIDPGPVESAFMFYDSGKQKLLEFGKVENEKLLAMLPLVANADALAIEYPAPRGQPMYTQLVDTIFWIGRYVQAAGRPWNPIDRKDVKMCLCGNTKAKDGNIRAALLSRFPATGGGQMPQLGTKKQPGPLYGVSSDVWSALAVAITYVESQAYLT